MIEERLVEKRACIQKKPPIYRGFRPGDVRHSQANIEKSQLLLGYQPQYPISKGLDETVDWYVTKKDNSAAPGW
jgi:UDP-N-acetylglucosamine 4-epimerase